MFLKSLKRFSNVSIFSKIGEKDSIFDVVYTTHDRHSRVPMKSSGYSSSLSNFMDDFTIFRKRILPTLEGSVESRLLEKYKQNLSKVERTDADVSYLRLQQNLQSSTSKDELDDLNFKNKYNDPNYKKFMENDFKRQIQERSQHIINDYDNNHFNNHTYASIGKYSIVPFMEVNKCFPDNGFGKFQNDDYPQENIFGVMCREEGIRITNLLKMIKTDDDLNLPLKEIFENKVNFKEELKNLDVFSLYFQHFSHYLNDVLNDLPNKSHKYLFTNTDVFDSLVLMFVTSLKKANFANALVTPSSLTSIMTFIVNKIVNDFEADVHIFNFTEIIQRFKKFRVIYSTDGIVEYAAKQGASVTYDFPSSAFTFYLENMYLPGQKHWRPSDIRDISNGTRGFNSGILLTGQAGSGKSMIMNYVKLWAIQNNWIVCTVNASEFVDDFRQYDPHECGLFIQHDLARDWLVQFKQTNFANLDVEIDYEIYGKCNYAGVYDNEAAVPVFYDPLTKSYTDDWKKVRNILEKENLSDDEYFAEDHAGIEDYKNNFDHSNKINDFLPRPGNLLELVNFGIENGRMSTCVIGELMVQLYNNKNLKTIVMVDEYNEWFKPSEYASYRYANKKKYRCKIPPYDVALVRLFMKFDGHFIRNGFKLFATSTGKFHKHKFDPESINFLKYFTMNVGSLKLNDVRNAMLYYSFCNKNKLVLNENMIEHIYNNSQGNWNELKKRINSEFYERSNYVSYQNCLDNHFGWKKFKKERKLFK